LQRAIADLQRGPSVTLADAAIRLGYFDQAHMANEFRDLAGVTPIVARSSAGSIFTIPSLFADP
jgi:AraC-like DNA-binding protein